jgi:mannose-6-phosphate isomerase class I
LALRCSVQHYGWGDPVFIPRLVGRANLARRPFAELWIGAHPDLPATVDLDGVDMPLDQLIAAAPEALLGLRTVNRFGPRLPFLLKVLAARQPLSIQVHPNRSQASQGFEREERAGVAVTDPKRNYRDRNHKPELLVALSDFHALLGFRPWQRIAETLAETPELAALSEHLAPSPAALQTLYCRLMRMSQQEVNALLDPLVTRLAQEQATRPFGQDDHRFWLLKADRSFSIPGRRDRGLFSFLLLNLIHLRPGEAIFLPAGQLHSYLQGAGLELMPNSNNVLRGGLTPKHIDVDELLRVVHFNPGWTAVVEQQSSDGSHRRYRVPAPEFMLEQRQMQRGEVRDLEVDSIVLGIVLQGTVEIAAGNGSQGLGRERGEVFLIPAPCRGRLYCRQDARVYLASVPEHARDPWQLDSQKWLRTAHP